MPIKLPNLDDRTFADLVAEAQALIPVHAPEWTNHNEADPGITLVELFAYLTEMLIYRLNRVTDANVCAFLQLIDGIERKPSDENRGMISMQKNGIACLGEVALSDEVRRVVLNLRQQDRAVTCEDFERLALASSPKVKRAYCVPQRNLTSSTPYEQAEGHVSVVILMNEGDPTEEVSQYIDLAKEVSEYIAPRCLLTTRVHALARRFVSIGVHVTLHLKPDAKQEEVLPTVSRVLDGFLNPYSNGPDKPGWPFGRPVYISEIYRLLNGIPGVDFVTKAGAIDKKSGKTFEILTAYDDAALDISSKRRITFPEDKSDGELVAISLRPDELVKFSMEKSDLEYEQAARKDEAAGNQ